MPRVDLKPTSNLHVNDEYGSILVIGNRERAVVGFDNPPRDRQAQTTALVMVFNILHRKLIKDVLLTLWGNFFPVIGNLYSDAVSYGFDAGLHNRSLTSKLYSIIKKRIKGDPQQLWIPIDLEIRVNLDLKLEVFFLCLFCEPLLTFSNKVIQPDLVFLDRDAS